MKWALVAVLAIGCATGALKGEPPQDRPGLYSLLTPRDAPEAFAPARDCFARAAEDYRRERFREAADGFMQAASLLRGPRRDEATYRADRALCYRNAAAAFTAARAPEAARAAYRAALDADPECGETLRQLLDEGAPAR